ncbi:MAG TPA: PLP-dependent aspartate aminotransferase family protein [Steroidobacteraceae bacterium]|nr:PLP-dependent aspartate aminotransferase family protein [Steroidobacteraceae bacterium]
MSDSDTGRKLDFGTRVIHGGQRPDPQTGAVMTPIYLTSTYVQDSPGVHKGYDYARTRNPTRDALQAALANLENGTAAFAFASGMAASSTLIELLDANSHLIASHDLYGGSYRLFEKIRKRTAGLEVSFVDLSQPAAFEAAIRPNTRMVWMESPTNPMLNLIDVAAVAQLARQHRILSVCDNTFATPYIQRPLDLGVDIVMHSATKYLNGHSDVLAGAVIVRDAALAEQLAFLQNGLGSISGAFDSFMLLRGMKTLAVRMERHCANGLRIAQHLEAHPAIRRVRYPGLASHPQHELARRQMQGGFGGIIAAELKGDLATARRFLERCHLFSLGESLGGVESLIEHPGLMTHSGLPVQMRADLGISDGLVRLSVGIESAADLIAELDAALG